MTEITLSIKGLRKRIGKREIIKGLDFELKSGEVFGFLGPNGAGKTTTIRMLVGLIRPTAGSIHVCGYDVKRDFVKAMSHLGCIVENPELYPYLTGMENLQHFSRMIPDFDSKHLEYVVKLVRLQDRINDPVKTYSLGMRQRLGIAQALLGRPKVLILDEPTNGLDPMGIREMREFIRFLAEKEGLTVLVSSHLLSEIQLMCDRVAVISKGRVIKVDTVSNLLNFQEQLVWKVTPVEKGRKLLQTATSVILDEEKQLVTPLSENSSVWNRMLVENGVEVHEIQRKVPTLEDLFLELTGGESVE
ncbi:ABC transporter ATP-binding protein [Robertmurraya korlensis]|uniref:ABC transporter ATP-binding protein n=1 Tax=Robertmurraya korlensis TaxID=519977 RepID=UPI0020411934|nr:ABC transporter ATP-binding protein [Robertmurraya korlensis]MCM3601494.1 ABC transporter ATP-binding protein [Robertmurraya korlensis]